MAPNFKHGPLLFVGICVLVCPLFHSSCHEEPDKLPPVTMEGKNTFGCLINGKIFVPNGPLGQPGLHAEISSHADTVTLIIYASNTATKKVLNVAIYDTPTLQAGKVYDLKNSTAQVQYIDYENSKSCTYDSVEEGYITLSKFELTESIISGTFQIRLLRNNCTDVIDVRQGRFDTRIN